LRFCWTRRPSKNMGVAMRRRPPWKALSVCAAAALAVAALLAEVKSSAFVSQAAARATPSRLAGSQSLSGKGLSSPSVGGGATAALFHALGCAALIAGAAASRSKGRASSPRAKVVLQANWSSNLQGPGPRASSPVLQANSVIDAELIDTGAPGEERGAVTSQAEAIFTTVVASPASQECVPCSLRVPAMGASARRAGCRRSARTARRASARTSGASRSQRRHVGAKLQATPSVAAKPLAFDASRLRAVIQRGLGCSSGRSCAEHRSEFHSAVCRSGLGSDSWVAVYCLPRPHHLNMTRIS